MKKIIKFVLIFLMLVIPSMSLSEVIYFNVYSFNSSIQITRQYHYKKYYKSHYYYRSRDLYIVHRQEERRYIEKVPHEVIIIPRGSSTYYYCR